MGSPFVRRHRLARCCVNSKADPPRRSPGGQEYPEPPLAGWKTAMSVLLQIPGYTPVSTPSALSSEPASPDPGVGGPRHATTGPHTTRTTPLRGGHRRVGPASADRASGGDRSATRSPDRDRPRAAAHHHPGSTEYTRASLGSRYPGPRSTSTPTRIRSTRTWLSSTRPPPTSYTSTRVPSPPTSISTSDSSPPACRHPTASTCSPRTPKRSPTRQGSSHDPHA